MAQGRSTKIISMIQWIRTSGLSIKNPLYGRLAGQFGEQTSVAWWWIFGSKRCASEALRAGCPLHVRVTSYKTRSAGRYGGQTSVAWRWMAPRGRCQEESPTNLEPFVFYYEPEAICYQPEEEESPTLLLLLSL